MRPSQREESDGRVDLKRLPMGGRVQRKAPARSEDHISSSILRAVDPCSLHRIDRLLGRKGLCQARIDQPAVSLLRELYKRGERTEARISLAIQTDSARTCSRHCQLNFNNKGQPSIAIRTNHFGQRSITVLLKRPQSYFQLRLSKGRISIS